MVYACQWSDCDDSFSNIDQFEDHIIQHVVTFCAFSLITAPNISTGGGRGNQRGDHGPGDTNFSCQWTDCSYTIKEQTDIGGRLLRHALHHCYTDYLIRSGVEYAAASGISIQDCQFPPKSSALTDFPDSLQCLWSDCAYETDSIRGFYLHIKQHASSSPDKRCYWSECDMNPEFCSKASLIRHIHDTHTNDPQLACPQCLRHYTKLPEFRNHFSSEMQNKPYVVCLWEGCAAEFTDLPLLEGHVTQEHVTGCREEVTDYHAAAGEYVLSVPYQRCQWVGCTLRHTDPPPPPVIGQQEGLSSQPLEVAGVELPPDALRRHLLLHCFLTGRAIYTARNLTKKGNANLPVCKRTRIHNYEFPVLTSRFYCQWDTCDFSTECVRRYYEHVNCHIPTQGPFICLWNGAGEDDVADRKGAESGQLVCGTDRPFTSGFGLQRHLGRHVGYRPFECLVCGRAFLDFTGYKEHLDPLNCDKKSEITIHCPHCPQVFLTKHSLNTHLRTHKNTFLCQHCGLSLSTHYARQQHIKKLHSPAVESLRCQHCPANSRVFACKASLQRHIASQHPKKSLIHNAATEGGVIEVLVCTEPLCAFNAASERAYRQHWLKCHSSDNKKIYACHLCDKTFVRGDRISQHLRDGHNINSDSLQGRRFCYELYVKDGYYKLSERFRT